MLLRLLGCDAAANLRSAGFSTVEPGKPLGILDAGSRCGDSLLGVFDLKALELGIPDRSPRQRPQLWRRPTFRQCSKIDTLRLEKQVPEDKRRRS
jgi:hypothetical protein